MYFLKNRFQTYAAIFRWQALSANQATSLGWFFTLGSVVLLFLSSDIANLSQVNFLSKLVASTLLTILLLLRLVYNALDGLIAREKGTADFFGEQLNENSDVIGDSLLMGALAYLIAAPLWLAWLGNSTLWFSELNGVLPKTHPEGQRLYASLGGGKTERSLWIIVIYFFHLMSWHLLTFGAYLLAVILIFLTGLFRIYRGYQITKDKLYTSITTVGR